MEVFQDMFVEVDELESYSRIERRAGGGGGGRGGKGGGKGGKGGAKGGPKSTKSEKVTARWEKVAEGLLRAAEAGHQGLILWTQVGGKRKPLAIFPKGCLCYTIVDKKYVVVDAETRMVQTCYRCPPH